MPRLVQVTPFYSPHLGGVETHVKELNKELLKKNFQITVLTTQHDADVSLKEDVAGVKVLRLPKITSNKKFQTWKWIWQQRQILQAADVIHIHDIVWWLYPFLFLWRHKTSATFHGWEGIYPIPLKNKLQRRFNSWLVTKRIHVGAWIQDFYGDEPDAVMYGGVSPQTGAQLTVPNQKEIKCVFIGRLETVNEISLYLELLQLLKKIGLPFTVIWVGEGSYRLACQVYGEVTGMVENPSRFLEKADLVFATSYLSILEAQALGKVVVGFYSHPLKKAYLQTFPGNSAMLAGSQPSIIADEIQSLLKDTKKWQQLSRSAVQNAHDQTWKKVAKIYQKIWHFN